MRRLLLPLLPIALLTGCFDFDCEEVQAKVDWQPELTALHVDLVLANLGLGTFGCQDVDACVAAVKHALAPLPPEGAGEDVDGFWPARSLAEDGATDVVVALERRGGLVDLHMTFTAPPNSDAAEPTDIYVVERGPVGKAHPRVLVSLSAGDTMEPHKGERFVYTYPTSDGHESTELYLLPKSVESVSVRRPKNATVVPMLTAMPGLDEALQAAGLLAP